MGRTDRIGEPRVTEVRVHGVSGTPPQAMLDCRTPDQVRQVLGDELTGFWERTREGHEVLPAYMRSHGWAVQAYSWGNLTSGAKGAVSRALWLALAPFALANLASWARPGLSANPATADGSGAGSASVSAAGDIPATYRPNRSAAVLVRLAAVALTCLFVATAAAVSMDMVAYQCFRGGDLLCPNLPSQTQFLADPTWQPPQRRLVVGALGPAAVLVLLWWLGRVTWQRYEQTADQSAGSDETQNRRTYPHLLEATGMWSGWRRWRWLAATHLLAGVGMTLLLLAGALGLVVPGLPAEPVGAALGAAMLAGAVLAAALASDGPEVEGPTGRPPRSPRVMDAALGVAVLAAVGYLAWVALAVPAGAQDFVDLPVFADATTVLVVLLGLLVTAGVVAWALPGDARMAAAGQRVGIVVVLLVGAVGGGWWAAADTTGLWWLLAPILGLAAAVGLHVGPHRPQRGPLAFRGAAVGVLMGAGLFVALLFSTAAVLGVAAWLSGPARLGTLPVGYAAPPLCRDHQPTDTSLAECGQLIAGGDVQVIDGDVQVTGETVAVGAGRVSVGSLERPGNPRLAIPSLIVDGEPVDLLLQEDPRPALVTTRLGQRESGTVDMSSAPAGPVLTLRPGVLVETRQPPYRQELVVPPAYRAFAAVLPAFLVGVTVIGAVAVAQGRGMAGAVTSRADADLAAAGHAAPPPEVPSALREHVERTAERLGGLPAERRARLLDAMSSLRAGTAVARRGETLLGQIALVAAAAMLVSGIAAVATNALDPADPPLPGLQQVGAGVVTAGMYLSAALAVGVIALGGAVRRDAAVRRPVGVLWDLSCFWPRVAHPFAPPCYAERAVPDLYERLSAGTAGTGPIVLSGHSLGSFLSVAAIYRLPHTYPEVASGQPTVRDRSQVALLTYGSQLRYYWGRLFPGAFGPPVLGAAPARPAPGAGPGRLWLTRYEYPTDPHTPPGPHPDPHGRTLAHQLGVGSSASRWVNLYRLSDPLGYTVYDDDTGSDDTIRGPVDRPVLEVRLNEPGDPTPPQLLTHSNFPSSTEYHRHVWALVQTLRAADAAHPGRASVATSERTEPADR